MHPTLSTLTFGAEFEVLIPSRFSQVGAANELGRLIGEYVHPRREGCPDGRWKVVTDLSVRGGNTVNGIEFVSPILQGDAGLASITKVTNALVAMGCTVNSTCGFHVHVGARNEGLQFFKNLVKLYGRYEDVIDSFMPASRRGSSASFAMPVKLGAPNIDGCTSIPDIAMTLYRASRACAVRYHKVNLEAYSKHRTVEFRQHAGTVDGAKAVSWIVKCLRFVAAAKAGKTGEGTMMALETVNLAVKTRAVIEMCSRPEGATCTEICQRFGYGRVGVERHARLAGVSFRKSGQRYWIVPQVPATGGTAQPVTPEGLANVLEETAEERAFFASRAQTLSGR